MRHRALAVALLLAAVTSCATRQPVATPVTAAVTARVSAGTTVAPLVIGETFTIASATLDEVRRINVYRPPTYGDTAAPLPVLYMPDGGMAEDFLHVAGLVQVLVGNGSMRPFLLVGIENTERRRDMTGPTTSDADRKIAPRVGGSAGFRTFIRAELMPEVRRRYRTTGETAIVGESLAGLFVVETLLLEPALFDTYVAIDPSLWWDGGRLVREARDRLQAGLEAAGERPRRLHLASSDEPDMIARVGAFAAVLDRGANPGLAWHHDALPDEGHGTIYHPAALRAFRRLFAPVATR